MHDLAGRTVTLFMIILAMIVAPICCAVVSENAASQREVYRAVSSVIDKVRDTRSLTEADLTDLYSNIASSEFILGVDVTRQERVVNPHPTEPGSTVINYYRNANTSTYNQGDYVTIRIYTIDKTLSQQFAAAFVPGAISNIDKSFSARVR